MRFENKVYKLNSITSEVNEFHLLLKDIFSKFDNYSIKYNHGPYENGADFIISRHDNVFGYEYIGVVVKIGKILKGSNTNQSREIIGQIDECFSTSRYNPIKSERICCNKVFVVTNATISNGAEVEIKEHFSSRNMNNINFFDNNQLIEWIDTYMPEYWEDADFRINQYMKKICSSIEIMERENALTAKCNGNFFIEPRLTEYVIEAIDENTKKPIRKRVNIDIRKRIENEDFMLIQASIGGGKSKLLRELTKYYCDMTIYEKTKIIPKLISYKQLVDDYNLEVGGLVVEVQNQLSENTKCDVNVLLLIDSFDEYYISDYENQYEKIHELSEQVKKNPHIKIILASRKISSHLEENNLVNSDFHSYNIMPLSNNQMQEFVLQLCEKISVKDKIVDDIKTSALMASISFSPIAAILLAELINENSEDLPSNLTELYSKYLEIMLGRWDVKRGLLAEKEYEIINAVMKDIARDLMIEKRNSMAFSEYKQYFDRYKKERIGLERDYEDIVNNSIHRNGIIHFDRVNNVITFKHRTFIEYYFAKAINDNNGISITDEIFNPYWMNSYFFYFGLKKDCTDMLEELIDLELDHPIKEFIRSVNMPNFILASYMTKKEIVITVFKKSILRTTGFYYKLLNKKYIDTPFDRFPKLQLTALIEYIVRYEYGYKFFGEILQETYISVYDADDIEDEQRYMAMFLISVIGTEVGNNSILEEFLIEFKTELPFELKYLITYLDENVNNKSKELKKLFKKIRHSVYGADKEYRKMLRTVEISKLS